MSHILFSLTVLLPACSEWDSLQPGWTVYAAPVWPFYCIEVLTQLLSKETPRWSHIKAKSKTCKFANLALCQKQKLPHSVGRKAKLEACHRSEGRHLQLLDQLPKSWLELRKAWVVEKAGQLQRSQFSQGFYWKEHVFGKSIPELWLSVGADESLKTSRLYFLASSSPN